MSIHLLYEIPKDLMRVSHNWQAFGKTSILFLWEKKLKIEIHKASGQIVLYPYYWQFGTWDRGDVKYFKKDLLKAFNFAEKTIKTFDEDFNNPQKDEDLTF